MVPWNAAKEMCNIMMAYGLFTFNVGVTTIKSYVAYDVSPDVK